MKKNTVSRPLLVILALTVLAGGYLAQGSIIGGDDQGENGFGDFSPIAFTGEGTDTDDVWVMPDEPRNPFLPFFDGAGSENESDQELALDLAG